VRKLDFKDFKNHIKEAAEAFSKIDKKETLRIISHLDADGISSCAILTKALNNDNRKYTISIVQQVDKNILEGLSKESYDYFVFTDLGSGQLKEISKTLKSKNVFIIDHHQPETEEKIKSIVHVNPHLFGIDGSKEISSSGIVYLFTSHLNKKNEELAHIAFLGVIGDIQERELSELNREILDVAIKKGSIAVKRGLRVFGAQTRPLHKVLEYSTDPYIPDVTGSETNAIQFLQQIGINPKGERGWKKLVDLDEEEMNKLVTGIVMKRLNEARPEDVLGEIYLFPKEEEGPTRDAKEFSTLLNACGRLNRASLGIGACLGDKKAKAKAIQNLNNYKKEIINALNWFHRSSDSNDIIKEEGFVIINARDNILSTIVGTLASIISKSNELPEGTFILSLAQMDTNKTKVSLRISGKNDRDRDLRAIIKKITDEVGGEAGGHVDAAGAIIPIEKEEAFIDVAKKILKREHIEERVV